jgi:opacity protein-like surface antigen
MRKLLLSAFGFVALSAGEAGAADLPVKAAPLVPGAPVFNWSGLYFGASVGAQWFDSESSYVYPAGTDGPSSGSAKMFKPGIYGY